jgi:hypothetical protein
MAKDVELSSLDLRYEDHRMKNAALEERLLASIVQRGIEEPLEGVQLQDASILLNGFKRYRCPSTSSGSPPTSEVLRQVGEREEFLFARA